MKRLFAKVRGHKHPNTTTTIDRVVCRITVYNRALKVHMAQYDIKDSERHLIGGIKASYPSNTYRVEVVYY